MAAGEEGLLKHIPAVSEQSDVYRKTPMDILDIPLPLTCAFWTVEESRRTLTEPSRTGPEGQTRDLPAAERQREPLHHRVANFIHQNLTFKRVTRLQTALATQSVCNMKIGNRDTLTVQIHLQSLNFACEIEISEKFLSWLGN